MIARGSMVVLKGHHLFPMLVLHTFATDRGLPPQDAQQPVHDTGRVTWLGTNGQPYEATYPLESLEEVDA